MYVHTRDPSRVVCGEGPIVYWSPPVSLRGWTWVLGYGVSSVPTRKLVPA